MIEVIIERKYLKDRVLGHMTIFEDDVEVKRCVTLERPWLDNAKNISCIPEGTYDCVPHDSVSHPNTYRVLNVPNRTAILLHSGNYPRHSAGCVLVGSDFGDIDGDGIDDITASNKAVEELYDTIGDNNFKLVICLQKD